MTSPLADSFQPILQQGAMLLLSCLDDALILALSKLGVSLPGLQWVSAILLVMTVLFWLYRLASWLKRHYQAPPPATAADSVR